MTDERLRLIDDWLELLHELPFEVSQPLYVATLSTYARRIADGRSWIVRRAAKLAREAGHPPRRPG